MKKKHLSTEEKLKIRINGNLDYLKKTTEGSPECETIEDILKDIQKLCEYYQDDIESLEEEKREAEEIADSFEGSIKPSNQYDIDKLEILNRIFKNLTLPEVQELEKTVKTNFKRFYIEC